jgi:RNA polymerase sigma-70 factor (ECF subfamily)
MRDAELTTFERLLNQHRPLLWSVAKKMAPTIADADDLLADTICKAIRAFDRYDRSRPFASWILQIMQRTTIDNARRFAKRPDMIPLEDAREIDSAYPMPDAFIDRCLSTPMARALGDLPECDKRLMFLVAVEGETVSDAAKALGASLAKTKTRYHRAKARMRKALGVSH